LIERTRTSFDSKRPARLHNTHRALDAALTAACGWARAALSDLKILRRLVA